MNIRMMISVVVLLCLCLEFGQAQDKNGSMWGGQSKEKSSESDSKDKDDSGSKFGGIPMMGPIDPEKYILGPSDLLALIFWGVPTKEFVVPVMPEGTLIIPTVGEIPVGDMTLAAARKRVAEAVEKKYLRGSFSMTLVRPRVLMVNIQGAVPKPGTYLAYPIDRMEKIILLGSSDIRTAPTSFTIPALSPSGLPLTSDDIKVPKIFTKPELDDQTSTRNVKVIRRNGDTLHVDIPKYYATLQDKYNPFLMDGDLIVVPNRALGTNFVRVGGAVNLPGEYEFVNGDSLLGIIRIAQGLLETADSGSTTIYRSDPLASRTIEMKVDLQAILDGRQPDVRLERGDRILVRPKIDKRKQYQVTIGGEVITPGIYPINEGTTKLSSLIRMSGGLTGRALLSGSVVWRKAEKYTIQDVQQLEFLTFLRAHQFDNADSSYFFMAVKSGRQPVVVDLKRLILEKDTTADIVLQPEDFVYMASNDHSVLVQGQVAMPGHVAFVPGADYRYYVRQTGGFQEYAHEGEVRIIKAGTLSWFKPGDTTIEPGDRVWVPKEPKRDFWSYFPIIRDVASVVISVATLIYISRK